MSILLLLQFQLLNYGNTSGSGVLVPSVADIIPRYWRLFDHTGDLGFLSPLKMRTLVHLLMTEDTFASTSSRGRTRFFYGLRIALGGRNQSVEDTRHASYPYSFSSCSS